MGRLHTHRHGKSHTIRPATLRAPSWITLSSKEIEELVVKYSKDGLSPSQIGLKLRDQHSIPLIKSITKKSLGKILEENNLQAEMPEDLDNIVKKAVGLQKHLKANKGDNRNVRSLELIEAKVHRLSVYYKRINRIPENWKYKSVVAQLE
ncbi:MAG: 30S ribosomal protein S15 [Nitrosopumilales archaeon CG15_BIG_FIL_POST_REV_8_21_14_020_33_23]|jgi:small subunit ribosomal protein S15|nr:MAG: 30S ribosomal protein S15 [Nitrosopumilales archaeon CG11_big_fil_rev_8_21_14_0_20_33_24]PIW35162.1 MAG: 30S ribosomal protein S15 [Nitrosopumilales archaeon CG15_BIG_FIL_POST_REV_8_21_14_020_33_23]PIY88705.1 MAG: 30S ribosomal protein S15 [Nitrosopumilales archaeon CG_4_10_14_0_8_um_filter_34_8]PJB98681.1 MAG: 30S ribosomal protein S15 [Nitrosopumilales archaeon CG_4_9_14_0_8_um_filter_34_10]